LPPPHDERREYEWHDTGQVRGERGELGLLSALHGFKGRKEGNKKGEPRLRVALTKRFDSNFAW